MESKTFDHIIDHWELVVFLIGAAIGAVVWWLKAIFATKKFTEECRQDVISKVSKQVDRLGEQNTQEHVDIKHDIRTILSHLMHKDD